MNKIKKLFSVFIIFSCTFIFLYAKDYAPNEKNVKFLGRTFLEDDILWMGYSNSGAAFEVMATELNVTIMSENGQYPSSNDAPRILILADGERVVDEMLSEPEQTFNVFAYKGLPRRKKIEVIKISEASSSWAGIVNIETNEKGEIKPLPENKLKIEFIGDSITCGYGIDDEDRNHHFSTTTEDSSKTYAYKTAKALNADYSMVSVSGIGIISGYTSNPNVKNDSGILPPIYDKVGMNWHSVYMNNPKEMPWDFSKFVPDVVVINLGTNDSSYCKNDPKKCLEFQNAYANFIKQVRAKNPDAYIICALGMMGADLFPQINKAVESVKDSKVVAFQLNQISYADGYAADWHPTEKTNIKAAEKLTEKIKSLIK